MATAFQLNTPRVVHETVNDESMAIDGDSGVYYVLKNSGSAIWDLLKTPVTADQIMADLGVQFEGDAGTIRSEVERFLAELIECHLIVETDEAPAHVPQSPDGHQPVRFEAPKLEKYTDLQEILMVDPIHEVTDEGWPHRAGAGE